MLWLYIFIAALAPYIIYRLYTQNAPKITNPAAFKADPSNTVFVFDLHGVIFRKNLIGIIRRVSKIPPSVATFLLLSNPFFWYYFFTLAYKHDSAEKIIRTLASKYPTLVPYIDTLIEVINEQLPIQETVSIITKLKLKGFRLFIFSNIGNITFEKLAHKFPDICAYFDGYQVSNPADNWLQKPDKEAYIKCIQEFKLQPFKVVFIDDKKKNIITAQSLGIYSIHFTAANNLAAELKKLHALS